jgi:4-amino-4-deoxy-L-arabinose transferase-like glycosyltransferase
VKGFDLKKKICEILTSPINLSLKQAILIIGSVSIILRLLFIGVFRGGLNILPPEPDGRYYYHTALTLLDYGVLGVDPKFPVMGQPPGQSFFLAFWLGMGQKTISLALLGQVLISSSTAVLIFLIGRRIFSPLIGFWTGILTAIDPAQIYLSATLLSEPLFIFLMSLGIYLLALHRNEHKIWQIVGSGILFAAAGLTRNQGWPIVLFIVGLAILTKGSWLNIRSALVLLLTTILCLLPWSIRNFRISGEWSLTSSNSGLTLWSANNPEFVWRQPMPMSHPIYEAPENLSDMQLNEYYQSKAIQWIASNPLRFMSNGVRKILLLFYFDPMLQREGGSSNFYLIAGLVPYGLLIPFIFLGIFSHLKNQDTWILLLYIFYTVLLSIIFFGDSRIRSPIQPYLYLFAIAWIIPRLNCTHK